MDKDGLRRRRAKRGRNARGQKKAGKTGGQAGRWIAFTPHVPLSNPLTATDVGNCAEILIEPVVMAIPGRNISLEDSVHIFVQHQTLYNVYFDQGPKFANRGRVATAYGATVAKVTAGFNGRFFVGSILTPAKGAPPTIGNADGGTFRQARDPYQAAQSPADPEQDASPQEPRHGKGGTPRTPRQDFVLPMLDKKGWSILDWANQSHVDFHTANDFLKGTTIENTAVTKL